MKISDPTAHKFNTGIVNQLDAYRDARAAGLQPESVFKKDVEAAWRTSDAIGKPYRADEGM